MMYTYKKKISFCIHGGSNVRFLKTTAPHHHRLFHSSTRTDLIRHHLTHRINEFLSIQSPKNLQSLAQYHAYIITTGHHSSNIFISSKLISLYAYLHKPTSSKQVFDSFHGYKDVFLWNSIIKAYFSNGMYPHCLESYTSMRALSNFLANQFTIPMVVSACAELGDFVYGMIVHGLVFKVGIFEGSSAIGSSFVYMYSKCGYVESARKVFDEMHVRDVIAWTSLIIGYVHNGESEKGLSSVCEMYTRCEEDERPNFRTLEGGFQACGDLKAVHAGRCLHGVAIKSGLKRSIVVQSSILSMYSKCGTLDEAYTSFHEVPLKDIKLWTSIIGLYVKLGCISQCLSGFTEMLVSGIDPDPMVISCVISGLANSNYISTGKAFHGFTIRRRYDGDQMVRNGFLSMYCKFGLITYAENVFNGVCFLEKDVWNVMLCGYGKAGSGVKCIELFTEMVRLGINPNSNSLVSVISSCSQMGNMHLGRSVHCYSIKSLMHDHMSVSVSNSLIDMYGNVGKLTIARRLFCDTDKDIITWNTMISIYTHSGCYNDAFLLFDKMVLQGTKPTPATLVTMLSACAHIASFEKGQHIYKYIDQEMLESSLTLATALVDMYAKCGKLEKAEMIFENMKERDIISWNVMISGYAMHGDAVSALDTFQQMERSNVRPNEVTFLAILSACNHAGLVKEGKYLFDKMGYYCLKPTIKHYACMVDLFGRSGYLVEAENLVLSMPIAPDGGLWGALLSACKMHNNTEMGIKIAKRAIECDPKNDGYYVMISNLYDSIGMWEEAEKMRNVMKERGVEKAVGWSAV